MPSNKRIARPKQSKRRQAGSAVKASGGRGAGPFPVVGIGASAGGLAAISDLLASLPAAPGLAAVVVSHMAAGRESLLDTLLAQKTRLPVHQARDGDVVVPDQVYLAPPGSQLLLRGGVLRLESPSHAAHPAVIDRFFASLAADRGVAARGVVLSGTGSDGTEGLKLIRQYGGVTFAQDPDGAQFEQMPASAIAADCVDYVLPPADIAKRLLQLPPAAATTAKAGGDVYHQIIETLPPVVGVDFSQYKASTLRRRIAKRMAQQGFSSPQPYLQHLASHPAEARALFSDLLIRVSSFFRDPEAFQALQRKVIAPLVRQADPRKPIRVWVPGCARGEEVYTIAMLLLERASRRSLRIQLFGTDLSAPDIEAARTGRFPETITGEITPARLKRFFDKVPGGYQVRPELREVCVFACQEVGNDPPFSNLDLISCRNLMIYFARPLQERVIETFHYALKPGGALFLGRSESLGGYAELFSLLDTKYRIYRRRPNGGSLARMAANGVGRTTLPVQALVPAVNAGPPRAIERFMLERYAPPGLYLDEDLVIRAFVGDVSAYLHTASGQANLHVGRMLPPGMALDIRTAIRAARKSTRPVQRETTWIGADGSARDVTLLLARIVEISGGKPGYLVLFERAVPKPVEPPPGGKPRQRRERNELVRVNKALAATREQLQTVLEEQEQAAEELRAAHEEALSGNEELQSSNEELQTAKEELQSANEELATVNEELQDRNQQLDRLASELSTLIAGVNIPIVHLDSERRVRRFSPAAHNVFNLIVSDTGREFSQIKPSLPLPDLDGFIDAALKHGSVTEREVEDRSGHWYSLRVRPFRDSVGRIDGVLLALVDIDATKRSIAAIVETMSEPLLALDRELRVLTANPAFYRTFRTTHRDTQGVPLFHLGIRQWDTPELRRLIEGLPRHKEFQGLRIEQQFPLIGRKVFNVSGKQIVDEGMGSGTILLMFHDATDAEISAELVRNAREEEEQRIAHELHDLSGGALASLSLELEQLAANAAAPAAARRLRELRKRVQQLSGSTHDLARRIHPSVIEDLGLRKALLGECQALQSQHGIHAVLNVSGDIERLPDSLALCLYRVAQEALRNVGRHSRASEVDIDLAMEAREARLVVRDNGRGFEVETARNSGGMGLMGMIDRVNMASGKLTLKSAAGKGAEIRVVIPLPGKQPPRHAKRGRGKARTAAPR